MLEIKEQQLLDESIVYMRAAHRSINQKRKYGGHDYEDHPQAAIDMALYFGITDIHLLRALACHDIPEDVTALNPKYNLFDISQKFGQRVGAIVFGLTHVYTKEAYPFLNKKSRNILECGRLFECDKDVHTCKLIDIIVNTADCIKYYDEDPKFCDQFREKCVQLLPFLYKGNEAVRYRADMNLQDLTKCKPSRVFDAVGKGVTEIQRKMKEGLL